MKMQNKITTLLVLVFAVTLLTSCGNDENKDTREAVRVHAVTVKKTEVPSSMEYPGTIEGKSKVKLSTKLMGEITYLPYEPGTKVSKGQTLVKINSGDVAAKKQQVAANIAQAEAGFKNAEINYNRIKNLHEKGSATKKEMEDVQMGYDMAKAQLNAAKEMKNEVDNVLGYSELKAPFDGYIVNKFFEEGDIAAPGHPIIIVENFDNFEVDAMVSASDINLINVGQDVSVRIDAATNNTYQGKVTEVNPGGNAFSKQFEVKVSIDKNKEGIAGIKSGMYATIVLEDETKPLITVDKDVLVKRGQLVGVYSISDHNEVLLRWLRLGKSLGDKYEVLSGLSEGDVIITDKDKVKEGQKVEVI